MWYAAGDMIFLNQLVVFEIKLIHRLQPALGDFIAKRVVAVHFESLYRHPLQRRPAVGFIPLFAAFIFRRHDAARGEQTRAYGIRQPFGLGVGRHPDIQRDDAGGGE